MSENHSILDEYEKRRRVCLTHPLRDPTPCPGCDYVQHQMPSWVRHRGKFALDGQVYRIVSIGTTNRHAPRQMHFEGQIHVEPLGAGWELPPTGSSVENVQRSITDLFSMKTFRVLDLEGAIHE